jgi:heat shock protein beta
MTAQDVSKKGLKYGDEDEDEAEKRELEAQKVAFGPLLRWLKANLGAQISDGRRTFPLQSQRAEYQLSSQTGLSLRLAPLSSVSRTSRPGRTNN